MTKSKKVIFQSMPDGSTAVLETAQPTQAQIEAALKAVKFCLANGTQPFRADLEILCDALTAAAEVGSPDKERADRLRLELEKIAWMDEFLDADGARAMMNIAREAINNDN